MDPLLLWWKFNLERLLLRGSHYRLLFMASAVVTVALLGGLSLHLIDPAESLGTSSWWAFLRLTDPGYLGDDEGLGRRALAVLITVLGYVLFMGALIAILTQWLHETVTRLQRGETPISMRNHVLVLGLTPRTPVVIEELMRSEARVRRFLSRRGVSSLRLVVLVEELDENVRADLVTRLGPLWDDRSIVLRSGSPLVAEHLQRVDFARASVVLIPGGVSPGEVRALHDADTVKTVLSIANHPQVRKAAVLPRIVAEIADERLVSIVESIHPGAIELVESDAIVSRLIAQNLRHSGLSWVLAELLAFHKGNDLFYASFPDQHGRAFSDIALRVTGGVALGVVRKEAGRWVPHLAPARGFTVEREDRYVVIARNRKGIALGPPVAPEPLATRPLPSLGRDWPAVRRVLILGWGHGVPTLIRELASYTGEDFALDILSVVPIEVREAALKADEAHDTPFLISQLIGDYTQVQDLGRLDLARYHNVVILGRGWRSDGDSSDAQTILGHTILNAMMAGWTERPKVLVELTDPDNAALFDDCPGEIVLSPVFMARVLAHVAIRPELRTILHELFTEGGAEFHYRPPADYALPGGTLRFDTLQRAGLAHDELVLGVRSSEAPLDLTGDLHLAPSAEARFHLGPHSLLLVLSRRGVALSAVRGDGAP